jgi:hypothetical protein
VRLSLVAVVKSLSITDTLASVVIELSIDERMAEEITSHSTPRRGYKPGIHHRYPVFRDNVLGQVRSEFSLRESAKVSLRRRKLQGLKRLTEYPDEEPPQLSVIPVHYPNVEVVFAGTDGGALIGDL